jgi:site-specific recombinase XerD
MKLSDGIEQYVVGKHAGGLAFERGESNLAAFFRQVGDVDLGQVTAQQVLTYLNGPETGAITWRLKYRILFRFFDFWFSRGAMPELLMPPARAKVRQTFVPYVYTRAQLRTLLKATAQNHNPLRSLDRQTFRTFILVLYATGALVGEMLSLKHADVNLETGIMTIRCKSFSRSREIPLGADLRDVLRKYLAWRSRKSFRSSHLFVTKDDLPILNRRVNTNFQRLREIAGVLRHDGGTYQPRMHDLRCTFAVHRITSWIRNGANLNRMLPALAAYMGQVGLGSTERYLSLTPERFRKELDKLSPDRGKGRWRNDKVLMEFLTNL